MLQLATLGAHDAHSNCMILAKGIANGETQIADARRF